MNTRDVDLNLLQTFHAVHADRQREPRGRAPRRVAADGEPRAAPAARACTATRCSCARRAAWRRPRRRDRLAEAVRARAARRSTSAIQRGRALRPRALRPHVPAAPQRHRRDDLPAAAAARRSRRRAPRVRLEAFQLDDRDILPALESGRVDLALGYIPALAGVERQLLLSRTLRRGDARRPSAGAARADARGAGVAQLRAGALAPGDGARAAGARACATSIRLELPHFMVLPRILAETDLAVLMPSRLADGVRAHGRLRRLAAARRAAALRRVACTGTGASRTSPATAGCASGSSRCSAKPGSSSHDAGRPSVTANFRSTSATS